jgi:hypothetical protein
LSARSLRQLPVPGSHFAGDDRVDNDPVADDALLNNSSRQGCRLDSSLCAAAAGSFFTLERSHEVLGRFTIQLLGSFRNRSQRSVHFAQFVPLEDNTRKDLSNF